MRQTKAIILGFPFALNRENFANKPPILSKSDLKRVQILLKKGIN